MAYLLQLDLKKIVNFEIEKTTKLPFPNGYTVEEVLLNFLDFSG